MKTNQDKQRDSNYDVAILHIKKVLETKESNDTKLSMIIIILETSSKAYRGQISEALADLTKTK